MSATRVLRGLVLGALGGALGWVLPEMLFHLFQDPTPANPQGPIGLLAGSGRFPILFAQKARQLGRPVVCVGIHDEAPPELVTVRPAAEGRAALVVRPEDAARVPELLAGLDEGFNLGEPFGRVREAVAEARRLGVAGRAA